MSVNTTLGINDNMSRVLGGIVKSLDLVISAMHRLDNVSNTVGDDALSLMRNEIRQAEVELRELDNLLGSLGANAPPPRAFNNWQMSIMAINSGLQLVSMAMSKIGAISNIADEYTSVNARLNMVNDGLQTQAQLQEKVLKSANATRSSYSATANLISKIAMTGAIKGNDNQIAFAEKVNKMLKIGGGTAQMNSSALLQLSQALSSGRLQGDEFRSLDENAPALMQNIAKGMGTNIGTLRQMSSEGKLTTEAIIAAINKMGGSIDEQFNKLPRTFGENKVIFDNMIGNWLAKLSSTNGALGQLNQKFTDFTNFLSSEQGKTILDNIAFSLNIIMALILGFFDMIGNAIGLIHSFGGIFEGAFTSVIVAGLLIIIPLLWQKVAALYAQAKAWAIAHAPILMIAIAIGIVIGLLVHFGIGAKEVAGFVGGVFGGLVAFIVNIFLYFYNFIGQIAVFLENVFIDPGFAIKNLFYGIISSIAVFFQTLINGIIDGINFIIKAANKVGGNFKEVKHRTFADDFDKNFKPESDKDVKVWENKYLDIGEFAKDSSNFAMDKIDNLSKSLDKFSMKNIGDDIPNNDNTGLNAGVEIGDIGKVGKVGEIEKDVNISDEDIKMLYEASMIDRVNQINLKVETSSPSIINHNTISGSGDIDDVVEKLKEILETEHTISVNDNY